MQFVTLEDIASGLFASHQTESDNGAYRCRSVLFGTTGCDQTENIVTSKVCRAKFGGKALNLAILRYYGFNVPPGFVITTDCFQAHMLAYLSENPGVSPREAVANLSFFPEFVEQLRFALEDIPASRWAVRSSSTDEDSHHHSFAGLQESVIGIDCVDTCLEAIRTVWQSFYARERLMYPSQASLNAPVPSMAVIIQAYIASESAGVVFTRHPIMGSQTMLINVSHGQGANVVDGKAGEALNIPKMGDISDIPSECLEPHELHEIVQTALAIETAFGCPQDIEFAYEDHQLFILQTRDIVKTQDLKRTLYSNTNVGEALSDAATPMTWSVGMSIAKRGFETVFGMLGLSAPPSYTFVTTFYGHIYLNISQILSVASQVPFIQPDIFAQILGLQSVQDYGYTIDPLSKGHFIRHLPKSMVQLARLHSRIRRLSSQAEIFCAERDALLALDLKKANHDEIRHAFERLNTLFFDCAFDMLGAAGAFLATYVLWARFVAHFNSNAEDSLEHHLMSGLADVQSAAPGLDLLKIANEIRQWPALKAAFLTSNFHEVAAFKAEISDLPGGCAFIEAFDTFLRQHGLRAHQEAELANPRWREAPIFLLKVIRTHLKNESQATHDITSSVSTHRESRTHAFSGMLSRTMRPIFRRLLETTQRNARLREQWRAYVIDVLGIFRQFFLDIAVQLVDQKLLDQPDDIFFLTYEEILAWLDDPTTLKQAPLWVAFRKARHQAYQTARRLPDTFVTHPNQCPDVSLSGSGRLLHGLPASPGTVKARVRVAQNLEEAADLEYGEILVTTSTDVAWTPLFLIASAILTERGGPLSHAFVVAREYGLPAVVSIPNLLQTLKTGDVVTVCGDRGIVSIS